MKTFDHKPLPGTSGNRTEFWLERGWLLLACAPLPIWSAYRLALRGGPGRRRRAKGLCAKCGYDLRATPERCPECGRSVQVKAAQSTSQAATAAADATA